MNWNVLASATGLLILSNVFMTVAFFYMTRPGNGITCGRPCV